MTQISSIFNANGLIAKIAKKEGVEGEPPTLTDIQDMAIATPETMNDVAIASTGATYKVITTARGLIRTSGGIASRSREIIGDTVSDWDALPTVNFVDGRDLDKVLSCISRHIIRTAGEPSIEQVEWLHTLWKRERQEVSCKIDHPLKSVVQAWRIDKNAKRITAETEKKRPAATLPMKSAARVRDIFVESAETEIAASPPSAAQLMLPTLEVKQHLPEILPLEILQGIPLQTQGRQQVSMAVRLFFEGVMKLNPKQYKGEFKKSLGELVADLHSENDRIRKRDIDRVVKGIYLLDQIRIPYVDPVGGTGRFRPIRAWNEPAHGANKDFIVKFYVEFPADDKGGMLVIKSIIRRLGQVSPSQFNAYLAACWIFNRYGRSPNNVLIDPTMPDPNSARDERGVLLHPETHLSILDEKGKGVKDIFAPAAVKVLDRVDRAEASAYPVLSFDELTRACYPGVNLNKTNKSKYDRDALEAWDGLEREGIIRIIRHANGYQILPSSEHINLHRAMGRKK